MTNLAFPSEDFPALPAITLQVPDDWAPVHPAGAVLAAARAVEVGLFTSNVVVRVERRPAEFEVTDALAELKAYAGARQRGTASEPFKVALDGRLFVGLDLAWVDDEVGTVLQAHLCGVVASGSCLQMVQVTGSVGGATAREDYPVVKAIMKSLTVAVAVHGVDRSPG